MARSKKRCKVSIARDNSIRDSTNNSAGLSQSQPQLYGQLTAALTPEEQNVVQAVVAKADEIAAQQAQAQQQLQQEGGAMPPPQPNVNGA